MVKGEYSYTLQELDRSAAFPTGHNAPRALVSANLSLGERETGRFVAIADTGADYCSFPADLAAALGLDFDQMPSANAFGLGDKANFRFSMVTLEVDQLGSWSIYAAFCKDWNGRKLGFLGQLGFFDRFRVTFDLQNGVFEIEDGSTDGAGRRSSQFVL
jgi:hypothetical protein